MNKNIDLINLYWTTSGIFPGEAEISRFDFRDRVECAAKAGFKGIGLWHTDLEHIMQQRSLSEMKDILDSNGIKYVELEFLTDWFIDSPRKWESDGRKRRLLEASEALQAKHIKVGDFYRCQYPMPHLIESFAALCKEAENYGAVIGFEIMESSMINNLKDALTMVEAVDLKNGGLIIDIIQQVNLGMSFEEISRIPLKCLISIELNDGLLPGSIYHNPGVRRFCGEGEYDIKGLVRCVQGMGYSGPWALEVFNKDYVGLTLDELNKRAFETTISQFID